MTIIDYERDHCHILHRKEKETALQEKDEEVRQILQFFKIAIDNSGSDMIYFRKEKEEWELSDLELIHKLVTYLNKIYYGLIEENDYQSVVNRKPKNLI